MEPRLESYCSLVRRSEAETQLCNSCLSELSFAREAAGFAKSGTILPYKKPSSVDAG